jgi:hypothetical protein
VIFVLGCRDEKHNIRHSSQLKSSTAASVSKLQGFAEFSERAVVHEYKDQTNHPLH